jgi:hypothetical protein
MQCAGTRRPDGAGIRLEFTGPAGKGQLTVVLGVPRLDEGASGHALPVNVTIIPPDGRLYSTRGADKCTLDSVRQKRVEDLGATHRWRVEGRGFCLAPAAALRARAANDAILVSTFDFAGLLAWKFEQDTP